MTWLDLTASGSLTDVVTGLGPTKLTTATRNGIMMDLRTNDTRRSMVGGLLLPQEWRVIKDYETQAAWFTIRRYFNLFIFSRRFRWDGK